MTFVVERPHGITPPGLGCEAILAGTTARRRDAQKHGFEGPAAMAAGDSASGAAGGLWVDRAANHLGPADDVLRRAAYRRDRFAFDAADTVRATNGCALRRLTNFSDTFRFEDASSTQSEGDVDAIASKLADLAIGGDDRLILYVSAHGVSDDGVPYVLAPDYNLESPSEGRYSANDLIDAVARLNIGSKLLAFDCSRIAVHPRMGMAANEFASLVEKKSREVNDPRLTILLAGQELATSPLGLAERRAVLGGALVDALMGEADSAEFGSNNDRDLTLGELRSFVAGRCAAARVAAPAPRLLGCGPDTKRRDVDRQVILRLASGAK